jgi:phospholipase/lecithinase/hemolysin
VTESQLPFADSLVETGVTNQQKEKNQAMKTKPTKPTDSSKFYVRGSRFKVHLLLALLLTSAGSALAQPVITSQPASLAVPLGSNATFRVTATGAALTYQWRSAAGDLIGATNALLVVSHMSLTDLASYTVVVSNASGQTVSQPAWLKLARWTEMVVFGDSYCLAQYSNGKAWVDWLGQFLCLSAPGQIKNYAVGGAGTVGVRSQISQYLSAYKPRTNTLIATTWAGVSGDLVNQASVSQVVANYATNLALLAQAGGRAFILPTVPPFYLNPYFSGDAYLRSIDYANLNARMDMEIQKLTTNLAGLIVFRPDWSNQWARVVANPRPYGFTNATDAANACTRCDPNLYVFWDGLHPTTAFHRWIAQQTYAYLTPPLVVALPTPGANGLLDLHWQGGSPPFRVQHSEDLVTSAWLSEGPTFETNAALARLPQREFFRILYLGQ